MSPLKKPSSVDAIKRAAAGTPQADPVLADWDRQEAYERAEHGAQAEKPKPQRITLNVQQDLYRDWRRWVERQTDALDVPKLDDTKALRGLMRAAIGSPEIAEALRHWLAKELRGR